MIGPRSAHRGAIAAAASALLLLAGGCGGSDAPEPEPRPVETADPLPDLPPGWEAHRNRAGGYAIGLPRGWRARDRGISTHVRSFDRLVAISITPDRTTEALEIPLEDFATRALLALSGFEADLEPGDPRPFRHRYEAVAVEAEGTAEASGVRQRVELIVIRRPGLAAFTVLIAANARRSSRPAERVAERVVRTLRSRPVGAPPDA